MKKAILSPLTILWQTSLGLEAVLCLIPSSDLIGLLALNDQVKMHMLECQKVGRVCSSVRYLKCQVTEADVVQITIEK